MSYRSSPKLISCFCPSLRIFKSDFLIQALISRKIVDKNIIPISIAEKSFSFYTNSTFWSSNLCHWKTKIFEQITRKRVDLKIYGWNF